MVGFMKILMLGWEYPPMISGGLGTATEGLINGLIEIGHTVTLILPYFPYKRKIKGLTIVSPENPYQLENSQKVPDQKKFLNKNIKKSEHISLINKTYKEINYVKSHYSYKHTENEITHLEKKIISNNLIKYQKNIIKNKNFNSTDQKKFELSFKNNKIIGEKSYILGLLALDILQKNPNYQVIHANDWMSFTAVKMIKTKYKIPIVAHIHSTEIDRSGILHNNTNILNIEKAGIELADMIIAVSMFTRNLLVEKFHVPIEKIKVVYNANNSQHLPRLNKLITPQESVNNENKPIVTFVGRVTFQKGPSYFVLAAEQVLKINPNVVFKVVGTGDLLPSMKQLTWELGINKNFQFEGFLNSDGVQRTLQASNIFVMPSVSEPFGIVALEAVSQGIPIIISKQSGVSEVLNHAIKVDFWDIDLMADRILSILKYAPIRNEIVLNSIQDLKNRTWHQSAETLISAYSNIN